MPVSAPTYTPTPGYFRLTLDGTTTADIYFNFDPNDPYGYTTAGRAVLDQVAADMQAQLQLIEPFTTVTFNSWNYTFDGIGINFTYSFDVKFSTGQYATVRPLMMLSRIANFSRAKQHPNRCL